MVPLFSQQTVLFVIIGIATGSLIALVALSIVLVQRASGVINFSAAAFGGVGATATAVTRPTAPNTAGAPTRRR